MEANRFFSVSYDVRHHPKLELLRRRLCATPGEGDAVLGCWVVLLCILYDAGGPVHADDPVVMAWLADELMLASTDATERFLTECARCGLIDAEAWETHRWVFSESVYRELEYRQTKVEAGKKSGESRRKKSKEQK